MKIYNIGEVSRLVKLPASTLRYYEHIGLIHGLSRNKSGSREYTETDIDWIKFLLRLKKTGMSIKEMETYSVLRNGGNFTVKNRKLLLKKQLSKINTEIKNLENISQYIKEKIEIYSKMEKDLNLKK